MENSKFKTKKIFFKNDLEIEDNIDPEIEVTFNILNFSFFIKLT